MQEKQVNFANCVGLINSNFNKGILFYSGFFGDKNESHGLFSGFVPLLHTYNFSTLRFDMTGLGESEKNLSDITFSCWYQDSYLALDFFHKFGVDQIGIVGFSLGATYAILNYANNRGIRQKIRGIALWAPAFNPQRDMLGRYKQNGDYEKSQKGLLHKSGKIVSAQVLDSLDFDVLGELEKIDCPVLICHSKQDPYIPLSTSQSAQGRIHTLDELLILQDSGHSFRNLINSQCNSIRKMVYNRTLSFFIKYLN